MKLLKQIYSAIVRMFSKGKATDAVTADGPGGTDPNKPHGPAPK